MRRYSKSTGLTTSPFVTSPILSAPADSDGDNVYLLTVVASDSGSGAFIDSENIQVTVTDVDDAPVLAEDTAVSVDENRTLVGTFGATDASRDRITYTLEGADESLFRIDGTSGRVVFVFAPDFETPLDSNGDNVYEITVIATDDSAEMLSDSQNVSVTVIDVNDAPELPEISSIFVNENTTFVRTISATDADGDTITYTLEGSDANLFTIDSSTGRVDFISAPDFEAPDDRNQDNLYAITVVATDDGTGELTDREDVSVLVRNVNETNQSPVLQGDTNVSVAEGTTAVDTFAALDADGDTITYSLTGADADAFVINSSTGEVTFAAAPNFQSPSDSNSDNVYEITVVATDDGAGSLFDSQNVLVQVTSANRAPFFSNDVAVDTPENTTNVGMFVANDPDGDTLTYSLTGVDAALFTINSSTGEVAFVSAPDFETPLDADANNFYEFGVVATDESGLSGTQLTTVAVINVNEAPEILNLDGDVVNFTGGDPQTLLDVGGDALVSDVDSANFDSGSLTVTLNSANGSDGLVIDSTQITTDGMFVSFNGTQIGTFTSVDDSSAQIQTLTFGFNGDADATAVTALIRAIAYENTNASQTNGSRTVDFVLTDGDGGTSTVSTVRISLAAGNVAPESNSSASSFIEDTTTEITVSGTDDDGTVAEIRIVQLPANGTLYTDAALNNEAVGGTSYATTNGSLTLFFVPDADFNGDTSFEFAAIDDLGREDTTAGRHSLEGTAVNDAPVLDNTGQNTLTSIDEDNFDSLGDRVRDIIASATGNPDGISDVDADPSEGIAIFDFDSTNGTWEYSSDDGATFTEFVPPFTSTALLLTDDALIRFVPNEGFSGDASFSYRAWDQTTGLEGDSISVPSNIGGTGSLSVSTDTATITVNNVDSPHLIDLNGAATGDNNTVTYTENDSPILVAPNATVEDFGENDIASLTISGDGFGGADTEFRIEGRSFVPGEDISHTFDVNGQSITASTAGGGIIVTSSEGTDTPILTSNLQAIIQGLSFRSESDGINTDDQIEIRFTATDLAGQTSPLVTSTISLIGVNDSPELDDTVAADFSSINEDDFNSAGTVIADILARSVSDQDGDPEGIAIFNADQTNGTFEYLTVGATEYVAFGDVSESAALLLDASTRIRFVPTPNYNGDATISFKAWDQTIGAEGEKIATAGNSGGTNSLSTGDDTAIITVNPVNDAPTIDLDADDSAGSNGNNFETMFVGGGNAVLVTDGTALNDVDGPIETITVSISDIRNGVDEVLLFASNDNIVSNYDQPNGLLTFTNAGTATNADFEQVLNSLTYENTSSARLISPIGAGSLLSSTMENWTAV